MHIERGVNRAELSGTVPASRGRVWAMIVAVRPILTASSSSARRTRPRIRPVSARLDSNEERRAGRQPARHGNDRILRASTDPAAYDKRVGVRFPILVDLVVREHSVPLARYVRCRDRGE
jgi:hypothetical protein